MRETYRLLQECVVDELHGTVRVLTHERTGARILTIKNNDKNKVFMIGFRTTPEDSTGVAHIMEHSVLCGSEKYPIKDPFVELAKGSLNTFLNAMTYPDKTVYPVASVNDKDFMNLMDVYLDSVFHPNAMKERKIFMQEGWHYELSESGELTVNGVVYNEMKGAFSNPDSVLERFTLRSLFPDTTYANESGGTPENIPELKYEDFTAFHERYYHPSNSTIYLYGDMDMDEKLDWIDENYLRFFEKEDIDSLVAVQKAYDSPRSDTEYYAVGENEGTENKAYLSENFVILDEPTQESCIAWQVLDFILLSSPGAVLKEALIKAGIGEDIEGGYNGEICQPYYSVIAKNTDESKADMFKAVIRETLTKLCDEGISKKSLKAALNFIEFKYREEDYGTFPAGLSIGLNVLASWNYDRDPLEYVRYNDAIKLLKDRIDTDYFEELIRRNILSNGFTAMVNILPEKGLTEKRDLLQADKMKKLLSELSGSEREALKKEAEELKKYQSEPDSPEDIRKLPVLNISDIEKEAEKVNAKLTDGIIFSEADTNGIAYMRVMFDTEGFTEEEVQFASLLKDMLGELNTEYHGYSDLFDEILLNTGGISFKLDSFPYREAPGEKPGYKGLCVAEIRTLEADIAKGLELTGEMINASVINDPERIAELLNEIKSQQRALMESMMHRVAVSRASSYFSESQRYHDIATGIGYYDFVNAAVNITKQPVHMKRFIKSLENVAAKLFTAERVSFALYGSRAALKKMSDELDEFRASLRKEEVKEDAVSLSPEGGVKSLSQMNEGFKTSAQINYDACCGNFAEHGLRYSGGLQVLRMMLSYEYLWQKLRVLGGAYGCMAAFTNSGASYLVSYRDPEVAKTYKIYEELPEYLDNWDADEDTVRKYIIGAIAVQDMPVTASMQAANQAVYYLYKLTDEERQRERDEILSCTAGDIRGFAAHIRAILSDGAICTIGSASKIDKDKELFKSVRELF